MGDRQRQEGLDISAFFGFLRRRGLIIILATVVGAIAGYVISNSKEDQYLGEATIVLRGQNPQQQQSEFAPGVPEASVDREAIVTSDPVQSRAIKALTPRFGARQASQLVRDATVQSGEDSGTITIGSLAASPRAAAAAPNALGQATIDFRRDQQITEIRKALRVAERELARITGGPPTAAQAEIQRQINGLRQGLATSDGDANIVQRATPPAEPDSPNPSRDALIGAFAGLLLGFVLAMVREQLDRRVKHSRELEDLFGLPVLSNVPRSRALAKRDGAGLDALPPGEAEAFQMLRANLRFLHTDRELRSVVVTSPGVGDGKSTVSTNLAKADASVGKRVLLIEADMRRPKLGALLGIGDEAGLAAYLSNKSLDLVDVTRRVPVSQHTNGSTEPLTMDVVVSGKPPQNPSELINSDRMMELVAQAEREYDLVVIDTSPAGLVADAIPLMSRATAVVIVGRVGRITSAEADKLREQLERIDAPTFGLVANFTGGDEAAYGYY